MREIKIPDTKYHSVVVQSNGHLIVYFRSIVVGHIQFKKDATDEEIIEATKYFLKMKD